MGLARPRHDALTPLRPFRAPAGLLSLAALAAVLAGIAALPARLSAEGPAAEARVELELAGVLPVTTGPGEGACILVLREKGARTILPLLLPDTSAQALQADLGARRTPGMLGEALRALGARVREVEIGAAEETVRAAHVRLRQGGRLLQVDGRPSEAVALALAAGAPILVTRRLLTEAGLTPEELARARRKETRGEDAVRL